MTPTKISNPSQLVNEFKKSGEFDKIRRELFRKFEASAQHEELLARAEQIARGRLDQDQRLKLKSVDAIHRELIQDLNRYPLVENVLGKFEYLKTSEVDNNIKKSLQRVLTRSQAPTTQVQATTPSHKYFEVEASVQSSPMPHVRTTASPLTFNGSEKLPEDVRTRENQSIPLAIDIGMGQQPDNDKQTSVPQLVPDSVANEQGDVKMAVTISTAVQDSKPISVSTRLLQNNANGKSDSETVGDPASRPLEDGSINESVDQHLVAEGEKPSLVAETNGGTVHEDPDGPNAPPVHTPEAMESIVTVTDILVTAGMHSNIVEPDVPPVYQRMQVDEERYKCITGEGMQNDECEGGKSVSVFNAPNETTMQHEKDNGSGGLPGQSRTKSNLQVPSVVRSESFELPEKLNAKTMYLSDVIEGIQSSRSSQEDLEKADDLSDDALFGGDLSPLSSPRDS